MKALVQPLGLAVTNSNDSNNININYNLRSNVDVNNLSFEPMYGLKTIKISFLKASLNSNNFSYGKIDGEIIANALNDIMSENGWNKYATKYNDIMIGTYVKFIKENINKYDSDNYSRSSSSTSSSSSGDDLSDDRIRWQYGKVFKIDKYGTYSIDLVSTQLNSKDNKKRSRSRSHVQLNIVN